MLPLRIQTEVLMKLHPIYSSGTKKNCSTLDYELYPQRNQINSEQNIQILARTRWSTQLYTYSGTSSRKNKLGV